MGIDRFLGALLLVGLSWTLATVATAESVVPEPVGLSSERLDRIDGMVQRYIDSGEISGAVTLVARRGRVAHLRAQGVMDIASAEPMQTDTLFGIASMSKPVAGVAIMMLIEEGRLRLDGEVSS